MYYFYLLIPDVTAEVQDVIVVVIDIHVRAHGLEIVALIETTQNLTRTEHPIRQQRRKQQRQQPILVKSCHLSDVCQFSRNKQQVNTLEFYPRPSENEKKTKLKC